MNHIYINSYIPFITQQKKKNKKKIKKAKDSKFPPSKIAGLTISDTHVEKSQKSKPNYDFKILGYFTKQTQNQKKQTPPTKRFEIRTLQKNIKSLNKSKNQKHQI